MQRELKGPVRSKPPNETEDDPGLRYRDLQEHPGMSGDCQIPKDFARTSSKSLHCAECLEYASNLAANLACRGLPCIAIRLARSARRLIVSVGLELGYRAVNYSSVGALSGSALHTAAKACRAASDNLSFFLSAMTSMSSGMCDLNIGAPCFAIV